MFPVSPARTRNRGRGFGFNRGAKIPPSLRLRFNEGIVDPRITYTGSNGTYFNSAGTLTAATTNVPRIDYDPATLICRGLLIEESRTNSIRNNTMGGASAGTPGTAPTNWAISAAAGNLTTVSIIGTGTENGISYIDVRMVASGAVNGLVQFETTTQIAAVIGQTWTHSNYVKLVGGSLTNVQPRTILSEYNGTGTFLAGSTNNFTPTSAGLATQPTTLSRTFNQATTAFTASGIQYIFSGAGDITLRIGLPQLELGAFATSVIQTSTVAVTRAADIASMTGTNFSSWYNQTQGTFVVNYALVQPANGGNQFVVRASDNSYNNAVAINTSSTGFPELVTVFGGIFDGIASAASALTANVFTKAAGAYIANNLGISKDGAAVVTDASATIPSALTRLDIGSDHAGANHFGSGWIQSIEYYPVRDRDAFLRASSL